MPDTGPIEGRYMPHAPSIVGRYGKRPHSRMRRLQLRTVHDLISSPHAFAGRAAPKERLVDSAVRAFVRLGRAFPPALPTLARVRLQRLSPIGNSRNPPPRAENAANFFRSSVAEPGKSDIFRRAASYYGSVRPDVDFPILADLDMDKKLNLEDLISRIYKFDEINEGFRLLVSGSVARGLIEFD